MAYFLYPLSTSEDRGEDIDDLISRFSKQTILLSREIIPHMFSRFFLFFLLTLGGGGGGGVVYQIERARRS